MPVHAQVPLPVAVVLAWSIAQAALSAFDATNAEHDVTVSASAEGLNKQ
jgi:hypothetical protein